MIHVEGVTKRFGTTRAVDDITLTIPGGAVTAVLGLNGAGKSTLLRLIAGLENPDRGRITVCGGSLRSERDPTRMLGMQFAPSAMDPRHTVGRHLRWLAALAGVDRARVDAVLHDVGLAGAGTKRIGALSTGARQRLSIGSALLGDPRVLVLDEPANGLDVAGIVWLRNLLRDWANNGRTVVHASHLLGEVVLTADRVVRMSAGRVAADGSLSEIIPPGVDAREYLEQELVPEREVRR